MRLAPKSKAGGPGGGFRREKRGGAAGFADFFADSCSDAGAALAQKLRLNRGTRAGISLGDEPAVTVVRLVGGFAFQRDLKAGDVSLQSRFGFR